jgi:uncharacterized protein YehS (DUF1456 family)
MIDLFRQADLEVTRAEVSDWMKKDDDPDYKGLNDNQLAHFLNGMINDRRGKKEGEQPKAEKRMNNNIVFRKLKIALNLKDNDVLEILELVDMKISKHELSALFRNPEQGQYRVCKDQLLRKFIHGMQLKYHVDPESTND